MSTFYRRLLACHLLIFLFPIVLPAQTVRKMEQAAINRNRLTLVNGDTIQRFTTVRARPTPRADRMYYWQGQDHILRTMGAYNGHLLDGPYQLTDRTDRLLGSGAFKQGLKTGLWRQWRTDGSLASASHWRRGRQQGPTITYDVNSQPLPTVRKTSRVASPPVSAKLVHHWWQFRRGASARSKEITSPKESKKNKKNQPASAPNPVVTPATSSKSGS